MLITNNTSINFKGYDARELKGLIVTDKTFREPLKKALDNCDIDIYTPEFSDTNIDNEYKNLIGKKQILWGQDYITALPTKVPAILFDKTRDFLAPVLSAFSQQLKEKENFQVVDQNLGFHLRGGNFFICRKGDKNALLVGENKSYIPDNILKMLYNAGEVHKIPTTDYHLDLSIRPLDNGTVLVGDISITESIIKDGISTMKKYLKTAKVSTDKRKQIENIIMLMKHELQFLNITLEGDSYFPKKTVPKIVNTLRAANFHPVRVPGVYYRLKPYKTDETMENAKDQLEKDKDVVRQKMLLASQEEKAMWLDVLSMLNQKEQDQYFGMKLAHEYYNNFINAFAFKHNGELHYVTNASLLDEHFGITPEIAEETGFSTQKEFEKSISKFVKPQNIHYLDKDSTKQLFDVMGGVHCIAAEVVKK